MDCVEAPPQNGSADAIRALLSHGEVVDALARELARCAICERPFSALLIGPDQPRHRDAASPNGDPGELGSLILQHTRSVDLVGRYGESDLLVMLPETTGSGALTLAERLLTEVMKPPSPVAAIGGKPSIGVSIGVSMALVEYGTNTRSLHSFLNAADRALKLATAQGSGHVQVAEGSEPELVMRATLAPWRQPDAEDRRGNRNGAGLDGTAQTNRRRCDGAHGRPDKGTSAATT